MSRPIRAASALRGGTALLTTALVAGVLLVWAAAAPRPPRQLPGLPPPGTELTQRPPDEGVSNYPLPVLGWEITYDDRWIPDWLAGVLAWILVVVVVAAVSALVIVVVRALLRRWRDRNRLPAEDASSADVVPTAVLADQVERLAALGAGSPREGIVSAWARLEASIALSGVVLLHSRTSTEVVLATLRSHDVSADALDDLASLYREARYSRHELTEIDRRHAETLHRRIDAELERGLGLAVAADHRDE